MGLIELLLTIALVGLFVWALTTLIPMPAQFKNAIYVVCVVALVLYVLSAFGMLHRFHDIKLG